MNKQLNIKLIKQHPESDNCLRCCALMVFRYYKDNITKKEVWKKLHVYKKHSGLYGGYSTDLGRLAIAKGYKVVTYHYDWQWWDKNAVRALMKGKRELIKALRKLKRKKGKWSDRKVVDKSITYIQEGGKYRFEMPSLRKIESFISKKIPVMLFVRGEELYHDPEEDYSHAILVSGKKGNTYLLKDPYLALRKISAKELYYAWARNGGWMEVIYK